MMLDNQALKEIRERSTSLKYYWIYNDARDNRYLSHVDALKKVKDAAVNDGHSIEKAKEIAENSSRVYQGLNISSVWRNEE